MPPNASVSPKASQNVAIDIEHQLAVFKRGAEELIVESEFAAKLTRGKPLRMKAGFDPTRPDLHLGHTVLFNKMRQFQDLGHQVIFLVGDFTAMIGDPTGRNEHAPAALARRDRGQRQDVHGAGVQDPRPRQDRGRVQLEVARDARRRRMIRLAAKYTVARMLERDDFAKRYQGGQPIAIHEFLYPLVQGYDSVALEGRRRARRHRPEVQPAGRPRAAAPLRPGAAVHPDDAAARRARRRQQDVEVARQLRRHHRAAERDVRQADVDLRRADVALLRAAVVPAAGRDREAQARMRGGRNPRDAKVLLAQEIVARFHSKAAAERALAEFDARFRDGALPEDMPKVRCARTARDCRSLSSRSRQASSIDVRGAAAHRAAGLKINGEVVADKSLDRRGGDDGRRAGRQAQVRARDRSA